MFAPPKSRPAGRSPSVASACSSSATSGSARPRPKSPSRKHSRPWAHAHSHSKNIISNKDSWKPHRSESDRRPHGPQFPLSSECDNGPKKPTAPSPSPSQTHTTLEDIMSTTNLSPASLRTYLISFGTFPDTYRPLIWRFLLGLPENRSAYDAFNAQGVHPSQANFRTRFPIKSPPLADATLKVLSALAHWTPLFAGNVEYLPHLVFPLIKVMLRDPLSALELSATVIFNYCQKWWEYFPNPPLDCLEFIDNVLARFDPALHAHLHGSANAPAHVYAWPIMQGLLSESIHRDAWLRVWDHMITMTIVGPFRSSAASSKKPHNKSSPPIPSPDDNLPPPVYFTLALVAYLRHFRTPLMHLTSPAHVRDWITTARPCSPASITDMMHAMATSMLTGDLPMRYASTDGTSSTLDVQMQHVALDSNPSTPGELAHSSRGLFTSFTRLPRPAPHTPSSLSSGAAAAGAATWSTTYPPLTHFPHAILHYATTLHARLCADEAATLRARRAVRDLHVLRADLARDTQVWRQATQRSHAAMRDWWAHVLSAEAESWERARAARAQLRGVQVAAMQGVKQARDAWVREKQASEQREREVTRGVVARARMVGELRKREEREEAEVDELRHEWEKRWREVKREREREAQVERERVGKVVEVVGKLVAGEDVEFASPAKEHHQHAQQVSFAEDPLRGVPESRGETRLPWEDVLGMQERLARRSHTTSR
ncbi:hypothetical protein BCR44DRAFT_251598 [Catenaria anguillulae PL171]|uniref:Rab-GAP TBC domain-containing protein n=1 Tax=Catenaria anguillulae PL171 TaxID=765915 RepID=A0A1Y2HTS1_9FUNG|nr:hypothetical protein BCR44DRAFT_251598 [Catenaria anguillulae PL171]